MDDLLSPIGIQQQTPPQEVEVGPGQGIAAAFSLENPVAGAIKALTRPNFEPDPNFRLGDVGPKSPLWLSHAGKLGKALSKKEFDYISRKIEQENRDRAVLASQGVGGILTAMGAGLLSPTTLIPLVGPAKGAVGMAQAFALAGAAATLDEAILFTSQETRTAGETGFGIAAGTVLGGLLGSGAVLLRDKHRARLEASLMPGAVEEPPLVVFREDGTVGREADVELTPPAPAAPVVRSIDDLEPAGKNLNGVPEEDAVKSPVPQAEYPYELFTPAKSSFREPLITAVNKAHNAAETVSLPISSLVTDVSAVGKTKLRNPAEGLPFVEEVFGVYHLRDGNHRVAAALLRGDTAIEVKLAKMDDAVVASGRMTAEEVKLRQQAVQDAVENMEGWKANNSTMNEPKSLGAKAADERFSPMLRELQPDGTIRYVPLVPEGEAVELGTIAPATRLGRLMAWINPPLRSIMQPDMPAGEVSKAARSGMQKLTDAGVGMEGAARGITLGEGTVEARAVYWDAVLARSYRVVYANYQKYLFNTDKVSVAQRAKLTAYVETSTAPKGKMTFPEFQRELTRAQHTGDTHPVPEIDETAKWMRQYFFNEFDKGAKEAEQVVDGGKRKLYDFIETEEDKSYMHRDWDAVAISANRTAFIDMVANYVAGSVSAAFRKRAEKLKKSLDADATLAEVLQMERAEAQAMLEEIEADLAAMRTDKMESPLELEIIQLRQQVKDLFQREFDDLEARTNPDGFPESTAANRRMAREKVKEEQTKLRNRIEDLEERFLPNELVVMDEKRRLKKLASRIKSSLGGLEMKREKALEAITKNEDENISALKRLISSVKGVQKKLDKLSDAELDAEIAKLDKRIEKMQNTVDGFEEKIIRLENSEDMVPEKLDEMQLAQLVREQRLDKTTDKLWQKLSYDRESAGNALQEKIDGLIAYTDRVNSRRAVRNEKLREDIKEKLSPEEAQRRIAALKFKREDKITSFMEQIREAGGIVDGELFEGKYDFSDMAQEYATKIADKITGNTSRLSSIDIASETALGLRSPMRRRLLNITYDEAEPFLNKNYMEVLGKYANTVGADIELYRATGDRSGSVLLKQMDEDFHRIERYLASRTKDRNGKTVTEAQRTKDLRKLEVARMRRQREFQATLDRLRNLRGVPADPTNWGYRLGKAFINSNTATMMGSALLSSIPDAARVVMAHGLKTAYRDLWEPLIKSLASEADRGYKKQMLEQLELFGVGTDVMTQRHSREWFDFNIYNSRVSKLETGLDYLAQKTPQVAGFAQWSDWQKQITGMATLARVMRGIEAAEKGTLSRAEVEYLAKIGISPEWAVRISEQNRKTGTPYKDFHIPNTGEWEDWQALRVLQAAIARENDRLVITPGLEKPLWMDEHIIGRVIGQFRSFTMATNSKIVIAGLQERNMAAYHALQGATLSLAFGAVSYYAWAMTNSARSREELRNASWETWLDQAIYRSGLLGAFSEVHGLASKIPLTRPYTTFADSDLAGRRADSITGQLLGPSFGKISDIMGVVAGIDDPTQSTVNQARKLIPFQNVFYLKEGFAMVAEATGDLFNLPERRE